MATFLNFATAHPRINGLKTILYVVTKLSSFLAFVVGSLPLPPLLTSVQVPKIYDANSPLSLTTDL